MQSTVQTTNEGLEHAPTPPPTPDTFAAASSSYLAYIRIERGLSKDTVYSYASWLHHFEKWLEANGYPNAPLAAFNTAVLTRFLHGLHGRNLRPRTVRGVFYPLRGLGDYMVKLGHLRDNPAKNIAMPKKDAAIRQIVTNAEVYALLDAAGRIRQPKRAALARALFSVFMYGGLRRTETISLHLGDVDSADGSLLIRSGKGAKSRKVFPHADCMAAIAEWLAFRGTIGHDMLFVGVNNRPLGERALLTLLEEVKCIAGYRAERRICLHALRHNCATRLLRNGADIGQIQQFLGHTALQTTTIYLHTGEEDIRGLGAMTAIHAPIASLLPRTPLPGSKNVRDTAEGPPAPPIRETPAGQKPAARRFMERRAGR